MQVSNSRWVWVSSIVIIAGTAVTVLAAGGPKRTAELKTSNKLCK